MLDHDHVRADLRFFAEDIARRSDGWQEPSEDGVPF
jgi:hypothetical protein